jgi:hypothetical protein
VRVCVRECESEREMWCVSFMVCGVWVCDVGCGGVVCVLSLSLCVHHDDYKKAWFPHAYTCIGEARPGDAWGLSTPI